jgi:hypothetical protein
MGTSGDAAERLVKPSAGRLWRQSLVYGRVYGWACRWVLAVVAAAFACALAGCVSNESSELLVDPGRYSIYKCDDLAARWKVVSAREKELRGLMDRANQSGGGALVGSLAYRSDYDVMMGDERLLQRAAAEKNCGLQFQTGQSQPQGQLQSDQSIH